MLTLAEGFSRDDDDGCCVKFPVQALGKAGCAVCGSAMSETKKMQIFSSVSGESRSAQDVTTHIEEKLTDPERERWVELNAKIEQGMVEFIKVGEALREIRDKRLYREDYTTWEQYCRSVLGYGKTQANRLVQEAEVADDLAQICVKTPRKSSHLRELARLPTKELRQKAWIVVAEEEGGITAKQIKKTVRALLKEEGLLPPTSEKQRECDSGPPAKESSREARPAVAEEEKRPVSRMTAESEPVPVSPSAEPVFIFPLADGTQSKPIRWAGELFEQSYIEDKLRSLAENNRHAADAFRVSDSEITRRQRMLLGLIETSLSMVDASSEEEKASYFWAVEVFKQMSTTFKPVKPSAVPESDPLNDSEEESTE